MTLSLESSQQPNDLASSHSVVSVRTSFKTPFGMATEYVGLSTEANRGVDATVTSQCIARVTNGSHGVSELYRIVVNVYMTSALCIIGFIGNGLSLAVLCKDKRERNSSTNWLLQTLAVVDTVYLVTCLFIQPIKTLADLADWVPDTLRHLFAHVEPTAWAMASIAQTLTVWIVLLVAVDRYFAVCKPWLAADVITRRRHVRAAVCAVVIAAIIYNIPRFFERQVVFEYNACSASFAVVVRQTTLRANRVYILVYKTLCYFVFRAVGPLATLIVLNVRLIRALGRQRLRRSQMQSSVQGMVATATVASTTNVASMFSSKARRHLRGSSKSGLTTPCEDPVQPSASSTVGAVRTSSQFQTRQRQQNVTAMLVAVVTVFVVCELPDLGLRVAYAVVEFLQAASAKNAQDDDVGGEEHLLVLRYINAATNALLTVNSSVNFIIYYVIGRSFRKVFVNMYSCRSDRLSYGSSVTQCAINDIPTAGRFNHRSTVLSASSLRQKAECKPTEDQQRHQGQDSRYPQTDNQCDQIAVTKEQVPAVTEIDDRKRLDPVVMKIYWNGCSNVCGAAADV